MAFILNIDTSVQAASLCFTKDGLILQSAKNEDIRNHSSWLHKTIGEITTQHNIQLKKLDAVAVTIGPGSYTGLRVGLSAAKGLCFALGIPLITIGTLQVMAKTLSGGNKKLLCPLIDARRMEVFTAVYNQSMEPVVEPRAMIIDKESFSDLLADNTILFGGNGQEKLRSVITSANAFFSDKELSATDMIAIAEDYFNGQKFADLAYIEPLYLKEFYFHDTR
jgi:tRNA threonylcarbamoyladenosine biosynthesis protein TsaB